MVNLSKRIFAVTGLNVTDTFIGNILLREKNAIFAFLMTGALSAILYFSLFAFAWEWIGLNYKISFSIAYVVSLVFHFVANRTFTFKAHGVNLVPHIVKYLSLIGINYMITYMVMYLVVEGLHFSPYLGICAAIIVNVNSNFLISRFWVFYNKKPVQS